MLSPQKQNHCKMLLNGFLMQMVLVLFLWVFPFVDLSVKVLKIYF